MFVILFNYTTNIAKNIVSYVLVCFLFFFNLFDSQMLSIGVLSFTCVLYSSYSKPHQGGREGGDGGYSYTCMKMTGMLVVSQRGRKFT